jgi:hypothetical protein
VIPGTLVGALFLAACLVPGFIFLLIAERRRAQPSRSTLLEAVELAGVGAATSLAAATLVLLVFRWFDVVDLQALADEPGRYVLLQPARGLGTLLATFAASCGLAWLAAQIVFVRKETVFHPAGTAWAKVFWDDRPSSEHAVLVIVELIDGRRIIGPVSGFTSEMEENRELALRRPIAVRAGADAEIMVTDDDFLIIREDQIRSISGRYIQS